MDAPFPEGMVEAIETFLAGDPARPAGLDLYPEVFEVGHFFPLQRQRELRRMIAIARTRQPRVIMEIGADKGGGLYHWCKCFPDAVKIIACEVRGTPYASLFQITFPEKDFLWLAQSSHEPKTIAVVRDWLAIENNRIDVLFIDGEKARISKDFDCYLPLMSSEGVVFIHDVVDGGLANAWRKIQKRGFKTEVIHDDSESHEAMRRAETGVPVASSYEGWLRHWKGRSCGVGVVYLGELP